MRIVARAPVRTADVGGWTDTWFASHGSVCSIAIDPGVTVTLETTAGPAGEVRLCVPSAGIDVMIDAPGNSGTDPLLVSAIRTRLLPEAVHITVVSGVPAGSGLGTSAAVTVALLAAIDAAAGCSRDAHALACAAHRVETGLGLQSGIQDQLAAAFGGINRYDVQYPYGGTIHRVGSDDVMGALDARMFTVYLGRPHSSSVLHDLVIASLEGVDNDAMLEPLRDAAHRASAALQRFDLHAYGIALTEATEGMRRLHPELICADADRIIEMARGHGALGWKVNGAGGNGGSVAILGPLDLARHEALMTAIDRAPDIEVLRTRVARTGVRVVVG